MNLKLILTAAACLSSLASTSAANPYCAEMLSSDTMDSRYERLAPIYNATETGWIFGADQFDRRYVLNSTEEALLGRLVAELNARGTDLAILVAPPRPIIAGQQIVDGTSGLPGAHDLAEQTDAFNRMMRQFSEAGAIAPNLLDLALSDPQIQADYYFQRDTHWTNLGAAHSALALAEALDPSRVPAFQVADLPVVEMHEERGSLSDIVEATCGDRPPAEESPLFDYSSLLPQAEDLFGDVATSQPAIALVGTSFSDRYRRDQYQTADALSAALDRPIQNLSISGGGMIGPFEAYVLSGQYAAEQPDMIVWEFPYTYQMNAAVLRQLLGALRADEGVAALAEYQVENGSVSFQMPGDLGHASLLGIRVADGHTRDLRVRLSLSDGSETTVRLRRKSRVEEVLVLSDWWVDLSGLGAAVESVSVELRGGDDPQSVEVFVEANSS